MEEAEYKWRKFDTKRQAYERKFAKLFMEELNRQTKAIIRMATPERVSRWMNGIREEDIKTNEEGIMKIIENLNIKVGMDYAKEIWEDVRGKKKGLKINLPSGPILVSDEEDKITDYWISYLRRYARVEGAERITSIGLSQRKQAIRLIKEVIEKGVEKGWGVEVISEAIQKELNSVMIPMNGYRAMRIARTEVLMAATLGSVTGARSLDMPMTKTWLATPYGNYRPDHLALHKITIDMDDKFDVGGVLMDRPGDPDGGPENVCNCRCAISFKPKKIE